MNRREFLLAATAIYSAPKFAYPKTFDRLSGKPAPYCSLARYIDPGTDEFLEEKSAADLINVLHEAVKSGNLPLAESFQGRSIHASSFLPISEDLRQAEFSATSTGDGWAAWLRSMGVISRSAFYVLPDHIIRFEITGKKDEKLQYATGHWSLTFRDGKIQTLYPIEQQVAMSQQSLFRDVTESVFKQTSILNNQFSKGIPYWRSRLDPATGIDLYGSNGIAVGDIDNDGTDEIYICQPGGLPNRLLKFADDGNLIDISEAWRANMLDDTSAALFLDLRNSGRQDLVVLRGGGPVLLLNDGESFRVRTDAFDFKTTPQGGFTGMAAADYDRDGKLDLYLCCYVYFQSEAQFTYAAPYHDARNGPPNFLFRNELTVDGSGSFIDVTAETGMNENNDRFSFAPAWCDFNDDGWPDLYVANDFGRKNFYVNRNGHFRDEAVDRGVDDIGPGMSAAWFDSDANKQPDLLVANMWTAAGQRVIRDVHFLPAQTALTRDAYLRHTMGNSLLEQQDGSFADMSVLKHASFGRWAWATGAHDFDNDGLAEIFVTCGMLTNVPSSKPDLGSFFWRQVVNRSPLTAQPSVAYQNGWNALNQFIREDYSWNGNEPNVFHVKRGNRYYDFSGVSGLDFADDSRAFSVLDFDNDGRPDLIIKSRLGPQVRVMQNNCGDGNGSIAFRLQGTESNRDAIGARIEVDGQTKWLSAGSEFLSQHSKKMIVGLGLGTEAKQVRIKWPSGRIQEFSSLAAGRTYSIIEGEHRLSSVPFKKHVALTSSLTQCDNSLALQDTWFVDPIILPEIKKGPGLLALDFSSVSEDKRAQYAIFRRYLFDWRAPLESKLILLLDKSGHAVKIYASVPTPDQLKADLRTLETPALERAIPFPGYFVVAHHRDFFKFGAAYLWAGYYEQSLPYLERVLEQTPNNLRTLLLTATVADELNMAAKSEDLYRRAVAIDPNSPEAQNGLGLTLGKRGEFAEAQRHFEVAIELRKDYSEAINNLGVLYTQQGRLNDAIAAFQYGIRVAPNEDILYLNLGRAYIQDGKAERARQVMQNLLERKPESEIAKRALRDLAGKN